MKSNPLTKYTAREIHDEFYQPELLRAEQDAPPELAKVVRKKPEKGVSSTPRKQVTMNTIRTPKRVK